MFNEGFPITKKKETTLTSLSYRCPNPSCSRTFAKPLRALNVSQENLEPYDACPHCLTELTSQENKPNFQAFRENPETPEIAETQPAAATEKPTPAVAHCSRHFGYLSERSSKEKIPEECVTCTEIVNCMLKEIKKETD
jgi:hypothetical protein